MTHTLDFSTLPNDASFEARPILIGLSEDLERRLKPIPQALERIQSALMFAGQAPKQSEPWRAAAFLRAALAEYCSIEEVQKADRPSEKHFKLSTSVNPLIHLLELMRHLNIRVKTVRTTEHAIKVQLGEDMTDMKVYVVTNLAAADLAQLKNGKHYALADLERSVEWFKDKQLHWGAGDLIAQGTKLLAASLCTQYGL